AISASGTGASPSREASSTRTRMPYSALVENIMAAKTYLRGRVSARSGGDERDAGDRRRDAERLRARDALAEQRQRQRHGDHRVQRRADRRDADRAVLGGEHVEERAADQQHARYGKPRQRGAR